MEKYNIEKIWITDDAVWIRTADGKEASEKFADYQRLRFATPKQRAQFTYDEYGIRCLYGILMECRDTPR